jgi:hypothetical protein
VTGDECRLFGFASHHPATNGLSWLASSEVETLDLEEGHARTRSGRRYSLGRRFELHGLRQEGEEAWVVFHLLLAHDLARAGWFEIAGIEESRDPLWAACCKAARHLGIEPPLRDRSACTEFMLLHAEDYLWPRGAGGDP